MFDCANVEMRELLPELVAGKLDAATRARVEEHVASCAECASELETLKLVRAAFATAPGINVGRIMAALPKPPGARRSARVSSAKKWWADWRVAAALTTITVGGLSLALTQRSPRRRIDDSRRDAVVALAPTTPVSSPQSQARTPTGPVVSPTRGSNGSNDNAHLPPPPTTRLVSPKAQLSFGGGSNDLDEAALRQLMGALDEIDRAPVAPSAEPDRTPVLPIIKGTDQ